MAALALLVVLLARHGAAQTVAPDAARRRYLAALRAEGRRIAEDLARDADAETARAGRRLAHRLRRAVFVDRASWHGDDEAIGQTVDKGRIVVLCLDGNAPPPSPATPSTVGQVATEDAVRHVLYHELAHVASRSVGHTAEFHRLHRRIVDAAVALDLYRRHDGARAMLCGRPLRLLRF